MGKYQLRQPSVTAMQYKGTIESAQACGLSFECSSKPGEPMKLLASYEGELGTMRIVTGNWIVTDEKGSRFVVLDGHFQQQYVPVDIVAANEVGFMKRAPDVEDDCG